MANKEIREKEKEIKVEQLVVQDEPEEPVVVIEEKKEKEKKKKAKKENEKPVDNKTAVAALIEKVHVDNKQKPVIEKQASVEKVAEVVQVPRGKAEKASQVDVGEVVPKTAAKEGGAVFDELGGEFLQIAGVGKTRSCFRASSSPFDSEINVFDRFLLLQAIHYLKFC